MRNLRLFAAAAALVPWLVTRRGVRVIVAQSPIEGALAVALKRCLALLRYRVAVVVENHGDYALAPEYYGRRAFGNVLTYLRRTVGGWAVRRADVLRAISASTARQLTAQVGPRVPLERFMTWTDSTAFLTSSRTVPVVVASDIVFAGVIVPGKGVHVAVEAFRMIAGSVPEARLVLAGEPQNEGYAESLRRAIRDAGLDSRVVWAGRLPQERLATLFGAARVLVLPSFSEGLGRVIYEAMLCGTPAIGTNVGGIPDLILHGETGFLIEPGDAPALAESLLRVFDPAIAQRIGALARTRARGFFSPEAYRDGYGRLLAHAFAAVGGVECVD
jgi:glycosyltransferase involved in cell wall biosynthesis